MFYSEYYGHTQVEFFSRCELLPFCNCTIYHTFSTDTSPPHYHMVTSCTSPLPFPDRLAFPTPLGRRTAPGIPDTQLTRYASLTTNTNSSIHPPHKTTTKHVPYTPLIPIPLLNPTCISIHLPSGTRPHSLSDSCSRSLYSHIAAQTPPDARLRVFGSCGARFVHAIVYVLSAWIGVAKLILMEV
jgi:hypothetical protein